MNTGHGDKLSRKREDALSALLVCGTVKEAAQKAKVSARTLQGWMKDESFKDDYRQARQEVVSQATARLRASMTEAVDVLRNVMLHVAIPSLRVSAAKTVLEMGFKAVEAEDLEERLSALEAHVNKGGRQ